MKILDASKPLYLEMDVSRISLVAGLLKIRENVNCGHDEVPDSVTLHLTESASKGLSNVQQQYSNIEQEALGILHRIKKFDHYCFALDIYVITDHISLVAMVNKDVAMLSQWLQCIMLHIHKYSVHILFKPGLNYI